MKREQKMQIKNAYWFVIHPFSIVANVLEVAFFIAWLWQYLTMPVMYGIPYQWPLWSLVIHRIGNVLHWLVFISFFISGYVDEVHKEVCLDMKKIVVHYLKTYFIFDFIAVAFLDFLELSSLQIREERHYNRYVFLVDIITLLALLVRFKSFQKGMRNIFQSFDVNSTAYFVIHHAIVCIIILNILTIHCYSVPLAYYNGDFPPNSWIAIAKLEDYRETSFFRIYNECLLIVLCYFYGATYEIYPVALPIEQFTLVAIALFGRLYSLYLIAELLRLFGMVSIAESKYEQYLSQLEEYMSAKNLPAKLRMRLVKYYEYKLQRRYFNEPQMMQTLSEHLRTELFLFSARRLIDKAVVFKSLPKSTLGSIFAVMKNETFLPGDYVTKAGITLENVYFISSGTVSVISITGIELQHLEDGEEFGFFNFFRPGPEKYSHVAVETTEIYYIAIRALQDFLNAYPEVTKFFYVRMRNRAKLYQEVNMYAAKQGEDVCTTLRKGYVLERRSRRQFIFE